MKKFITLTIIFMAMLQTLALSQNKEYTDKRGRTNLIGQCSRNAFQKETYKEWFNKNYEDYQVNTTLLKRAKHKTKGISIEIFMGTWCGDSRREVPRFYKILDALNIKESTIKLITLGSGELSKQSPNHEERGKNIHRVPTFIFYKKGKEIGRIIESPVSSLEMALVQILVGLPTLPNYQAVHELDKMLDKKGLPDTKDEMLAYYRSIVHRPKSSGELNTYAYVLLKRKEIDKAIAVFRMNTIIFRNEANPFDSLAEAYEKKGDKEKALKMYKIALEKDPNSKNAKEQIERLEENKTKK